MPIYLRQSTASQEVPLGYFLDSTDGNTEETGLTIANTDIKLWKTGATTLANKNSGGATHISNGIYYCVIDATDSDTIGPLVIFIHVSGALAVRVECVVLDEAVYDVQFGTVAPATATNITAGTITTATNVTTVNGLAANVITATSIQADAITDAKVASDVTIASVTGAVGSVTGNVGGNVTGSVGSVATGGITAASFAADAITAAKIASDVGTEIANAVWDTDATGHQTQGTFGQAIGDPGADTDTIWGLANTNLDAAISSRMATYTQPTGFLSATFPSGTVANTTNITAGTITTVTTTTTATNVTTVNGLAANVITATSIAADAITAAKIADNAIDRATFAADTGFQTIRSNTAQAGAAGSITLDASASSVTDFYKNAVVYITGSTGVGQARIISAYNGTTKVATVDSNWGTNPSGTSTFAILPQGISPGAAGITAADVWSYSTRGLTEGVTLANVAHTILSLSVTDGVTIDRSTPDSIGLTINGSGSGRGVSITSTSGAAIYLNGNYGLSIEALNFGIMSVASGGVGAYFEGNGGPGFYAKSISLDTAGMIVENISFTTGSFLCINNFGGPGFSGNITGNITGNLSGSVGTLTTNNDKTGYALSATGMNLVIPADPGTTEPVLGTSSMPAWIGFFGAVSINKITSDTDSINIRNTADNADLIAYATSDNGSQFSSGPGG